MEEEPKASKKKAPPARARAEEEPKEPKKFEGRAGAKKEEPAAKQKPAAPERPSSKPATPPRPGAKVSATRGGGVGSARLPTTRPKPSSPSGIHSTIADVAEEAMESLFPGLRDEALLSASSLASYREKGSKAWQSKQYKLCAEEWYKSAMIETTGNSLAYVARAADMAGLPSSKVGAIWAWAIEKGISDIQAVGMIPLYAVPDLSAQEALIKKRYELIYEHNMWSSGDPKLPRSGPGSSMAVTGKVRAVVDAVIDAEELGISSVLDLGCGDLTWMSQTKSWPGIVYTGVDVAENLINDMIKAHGKDRKKSFVAQSMSGSRRLPDGDLVVIRDVFSHMTLNEISATFANIAKNKSLKYLLVWHSPFPSKNTDDSTTLFPLPGVGFRGVNLLRPPFNLPDPLFRWDLGVEPGGGATEAILFKLPLSEPQEGDVTSLRASARKIRLGNANAAGSGSVEPFVDEEEGSDDNSNWSSWAGDEEEGGEEHSHAEDDGRGDENASGGEGKEDDADDEVVEEEEEPRDSDDEQHSADPADHEDIDTNKIEL